MWQNSGQQEDGEQIYVDRHGNRGYSGQARRCWLARKEISPGISLEGMMLKLKLQYFGHLLQRVDSLEKTLMLGGIEGQEKGTTEDEIAGWHH